MKTGSSDVSEVMSTHFSRGPEFDSQHLQQEPHKPPLTPALESLTPSSGSVGTCKRLCTQNRVSTRVNACIHTHTQLKIK